MSAEEIVILSNIRGTAGNDRLVGTSAQDTITGLAGNDTLIGLAGRDNISGNDGNDRLTGGDGNDILFGDSGNDQLVGSTGNDQLVGGTGNDNLNGGSGRDNISGNDGNDRLTGGGGNDVLFGDSGNDFLVGGTGNDFLVGGTGRDEFVFFRTTGGDRISDFVPTQDEIKLGKTSFSLRSVVGDGFSVRNEFAIVNTNLAAANSVARIVYNQVNGSLFYNANQSAAGFGQNGELLATLVGAPDLNRGNFEIISGF
jgi:Ca2+-binding RTX toxin-like protein